MKKQVSTPTLIGAVAIILVAVAVIGFSMFGPQGTPAVQKTPIRQFVKPPVGGVTQSGPSIKVNVLPQ
jgi:hypothetical protein